MPSTFLHLEPRLMDMNATVGDLSTMLRRLIGEDIELIINLSIATGECDWATELKS